MWCEIFVTNTTGPALFGLPLIKGLNLLDTQKDIDNVTSTSAKQPLNKAAVLAEFPECFDGIGELKGTYHITLDPEVEPVINSPRRVPIALKDEIKAELASMEHEGVIEKVQEGQPTDWVNSIVYQRKSNGKLRICLDPRDLNTAIKREHHVTSSPHYPRSNGFIESQVKIVKRTLEKVAKDNGDPHLALLYLRSTPVDSKLPSPASTVAAQVFHGHSSKDSG